MAFVAGGGYFAPVPRRAPAGPAPRITKDALYAEEKERHWWNTNLFGRKSVRNLYIVQNIGRRLLELDLADPAAQGANLATRRQLCTILAKVSREMGPNAPTKVLATRDMKRDSDTLFDLVEDTGNLARRFPKIGQKAMISQINPGTGAVQRGIDAAGTLQVLQREGFAAIRSMTHTEVQLLKSQIEAFEAEIKDLDKDELDLAGTKQYDLLNDVRIAKADIAERETRIAALQQGLAAKQKRFLTATRDVGAFPMDGQPAIAAVPGVRGRNAGRTVEGNPLQALRDDLLDDLRVVDGDLYKGKDKPAAIAGIEEAYNTGAKIKRGSNGLDLFAEPDLALSDLKKTILPTVGTFIASCALTAYKDSFNAGTSALISSYGGLGLVTVVALGVFARANYNRGGKLYEWFGED